MPCPIWLGFALIEKVNEIDKTQTTSWLVSKVIPEILIKTRGFQIPIDAQYSVTPARERCRDVREQETTTHPTFEGVKRDDRSEGFC